MSPAYRTINRRALTLGGVAAGGSALLAAACGRSAQPGGTSPVEGMKPGGKIAYSFWAVSQEQADNALSRLKEFQDQNPTVQVEAIFGPSGQPYREKTVALITAGTPPDLMLVDAYFMPEFVEKRLLQRLDTIIKGDKSFKLDAYLPGSFLDQHHVFEGVYYALPNGAESPRVLFYNKRRFTENGLAFPNALDDQGKWTWDAYLETVGKLSKGTSPERYFGTRAYLGVRPEPFSWIASNGGKAFSDDFKTSAIDRPETMAALQFQADLIHRHRVAPPPGESLGAGDPFITGRVAMFLGGIWSAGPFGTAERSQGFEYGVVAIPKSPKGIRRTVAKPNALTLPVGVAGQRAATAWELAKFILGPVYQKGSIDSGLAMPNRKDLVEYFLANSPVKNAKVFTDAFEKKEIVPIAIVPKWTELEQIVNEEFGKVTKGEVSVQVAVGAVKTRTNELLRT